MATVKENVPFDAPKMVGTRILLQNYIHMLQNLLERAPEQFRGDLQIDVALLGAYYHRPESDDELQRRLSKQEREELEAKAERQRQYLRLREEFAVDEE